MRYRMVKAKHIGMQTEPIAGVVAVSVFRITANGMSHVGRMYANLILSSRFQPEFHQTMGCGSRQGAEMRHSIFSTVIHG